MCPHPINFWMAESIFMKCGIYIMVSEPIWTSNFISSYHQSVCLLIFAGQRLGKITIITYKEQSSVGFVAPIAITVRSAIPWVLAPCSSLEDRHRFGEMYRLHFQGRWENQARNLQQEAGPEGGGDMFLLKLSGFLPNYTALQPRR
jgi:hypothetical protein